MSYREARWRQYCPIGGRLKFFTRGTPKIDKNGHFLLFSKLLDILILKHISRVTPCETSRPDDSEYWNLLGLGVFERELQLPLSVGRLWSFGFVTDCICKWMTIVVVIMIMVMTMMMIISSTTEVFWSFLEYISHIIRSVRSCSHTIPEKVRNSRPKNMGFKGWELLLWWSWVTFKPFRYKKFNERAQTANFSVLSRLIRSSVLKTPKTWKTRKT